MYKKIDIQDNPLGVPELFMPKVKIFFTYRKIKFTERKTIKKANRYL
jgi:hypothetical protein